MLCLAELRPRPRVCSVIVQVTGPGFSSTRLPLSTTTSWSTLGNEPDANRSNRRAVVFETSQLRNVPAEMPVKHSAGMTNAKAPPMRRRLSAPSRTGSHRFETPAKDNPRRCPSSSANLRSALLTNWKRTKGGLPTVASKGASDATARSIALQVITEPASSASQMAAALFRASDSITSTASMYSTRSRNDDRATPRMKAPSPALGSSSRNGDRPRIRGAMRLRQRSTRSSGV